MKHTKLQIMFIISKKIYALQLAVFFVFLMISSSVYTQNTLLKANYHYDSDSGKFGRNIKVLVKRNRIIGDKSKIDVKELAKYGEVIELTQDDLFGEDY